MWVCCCPTNVQLISVFLVVQLQLPITEVVKEWSKCWLFFLRLLELPCGKSKGKCRWQVDFGSSRFFACYLPWALALGLPHTHLGFIIFIRIFSSHANYTSWRKNFVSFIISVNLWVLCILIPWTRACFFPFIQQAKIVLDSDIIIDLISEETSSS